MRQTTRSSAAFLAGALVLAGCGGDDEPQAIEATSEATSEPTSEPTEDGTGDGTEEPVVEEPDGPEDPYAIPDEIDVAYVQSVVDAIVAVPEEPLLEAYRTAPHTLAPQPVIDALRATRSPEEAATGFARYTTWLSDEEVAAAEAKFLEDSPPLRWEVLEVEVGREDCVVARFAYPEGADVPEGRTTLIRSPDDGRDPGGLNPTPWLIDRNGPTDDLTTDELEERCAIDQFADLEDDAGIEDDADGSGDATGDATATEPGEVTT